ncbi:MAG TPA: DUF6766 family protein, partial [Saprospiraceae bacterium]|nr:DUF6766 family protein [Saprospiraceae bacterium]
MSKSHKVSFFYKNSLSIVFLLIAILTITGQSYSGWHEYNKFLQEYHKPEVNIGTYFITGHFIEATFENWESEFLQMALFIWLTVFLRQKGSSESKSISGKEEVDRQPKNHPLAPWPVKKGGFILTIYKHSLTLSLFILFIISFSLHWYGSNKFYNEKQLYDGKATETMIQY